MLKDQPWIFIAPEMMTEWTQCMDEGLDVEKFRAVCEEIAKNGNDMEGAARLAAEPAGLYAADVFASTSALVYASVMP